METAVASTVDPPRSGEEVDTTVSPIVVTSSPSGVSQLPVEQLASDARCSKSKNDLQEYTQKYAISMPLYQTINEGPSHAPKFRSTVIVDGIMFTSPNTFSQRKAAEQDVARLALESLSTNVPLPNRTSTLFNLETMLCKSILNEYAAKMKLPLPRYSNSQKDGLYPTFVSTVAFDGKTYPGPSGKTKKEAEQLAARTAIESIIGDSVSKAVMIKTIKVKEKLLASKAKPEGACEPQISTDPSGGDLSNIPVNITEKGNNIGMVAQVDTTEATPVKSVAPLHCQMQSGQSVLPIDVCVGTCSETKTKRRKKKRKFESQTDKNINQCAK